MESLSLEAHELTEVVSQSHQPFVFETCGLGGFLAVESGHLALAGPVKSGANVVLFATPHVRRSRSDDGARRWHRVGVTRREFEPLQHRRVADHPRLGVLHRRPGARAGPGPLLAGSVGANSSVAHLLLTLLDVVGCQRHQVVVDRCASCGADLH